MIYKQLAHASYFDCFYGWEDLERAIYNYEEARDDDLEIFGGQDYEEYWFENLICEFLKIKFLEYQ